MATGQTLRLLRTLKGIKQTALAKKLGISQQAYSKLENSKHLREERLRVILTAMNCTPEDIELIRTWPGQYRFLNET